MTIEFEIDVRFDVDVFQRQLRALLPVSLVLEYLYSDNLHHKFIAASVYVSDFYFLGQQVERCVAAKDKK